MRPVVPEKKRKTAPSLRYIEEQTPDLCLQFVTERGYEHQSVDIYASLDKSQELPGVHRVASLLKRWLAGDHRTNNHDRHGITA